MTALPSRSGHFIPMTQRVWSKIDVRGPGECWPWTGTTHQYGYGLLHVDTGDKRYRGRRAYRLAYEMVNGPIPEGLQLDHLCRNRLCCNPAHLEPVTRRENILRGIAPPALNARKTVCLRGHPFDEANTWLDAKRGQRHCRTCRRERMRARRERLRASGAAA